MEFIPIKTRPLQPPKDDIFDIFENYISNIRNWDIVCITSKIVAIHQWRCISNTDIRKKDLVEKEADTRIDTDMVPEKDIYITIKNNIIIPSAWIDESNANGYYIMRPNNLSEITKQIHQYFCQKYCIENIWIIITDSCLHPLRQWTIGMGMYSYWIHPLRDERWKKDIFGKKLAMTQINTIDTISAMATYIMWEWNECQPIVIWRDIPHIEYTNTDIYEKIQIPIQEDIYYPLLKQLLYTWSKW